MVAAQTTSDSEAIGASTKAGTTGVRLVLIITLSESRRFWNRVKGCCT